MSANWVVSPLLAGCRALSRSNRTTTGTGWTNFFTAKLWKLMKSCWSQMSFSPSYLAIRSRTVSWPQFLACVSISLRLEWTRDNENKLHWPAAFRRQADTEMCCESLSATQIAVFGWEMENVLFDWTSRWCWHPAAQCSRPYGSMWSQRLENETSATATYQCVDEMATFFFFCLVKVRVTANSVNKGLQRKKTPRCQLSSMGTVIHQNKDLRSTCLFLFGIGNQHKKWNVTSCTCVPLSCLSTSLELYLPLQLCARTQGATDFHHHNGWHHNEAKRAVRRRKLCNEDK